MRIEDPLKVLLCVLHQRLLARGRQCFFSTNRTHPQRQAKSCANLLQEAVGPWPSRKYHPLSFEVPLLRLYGHHGAWHNLRHLVPVPEFSSVSDKELLDGGKWEQSTQSTGTRQIQRPLRTHKRMPTCMAATALLALRIPPSLSKTAR